MRVTKKIREKQLEILEETYRGAKPELKFGNPFELLIAVILSAQCTDKRVNITTERLFKKAATPEAILALGLSGLEEEIKDCGLFRNKAKNIMATCRTLVEEFGGEVPADYDVLLKLPGVGRKSANLIMGDIFGEPAIVTDTHCIRLVNRIGLVDQVKEPAKVEKLLWDLVPPEESNQFCHRLVDHGRAVCTARKPDCGRCVLNDLCRYAKEEQPFGLGEL